FRYRFISARLIDPPDDLLAPEFLQVVGGSASAIFRFPLLAEHANLTGQLGCRKSMGGGRQSIPGPAPPPDEGLLEVGSSAFPFTDLRWTRELLQHSIGDEA